MAQKCHSDKDIPKLLREIELALASGNDVTTPFRAADINDATSYNGQKRFDGIARFETGGCRNSSSTASNNNDLIFFHVRILPCFRFTSDLPAPSEAV